MAVQTCEPIRHSTFCQFAHLAPQDQQRTWRIFQQHGDRAWSYTDCSRLAVMQRLGIDEALSLDHHFRRMEITVWR
jgi:predicted nucleic acid-binding protein